MRKRRCVIPAPFLEIAGLATGVLGSVLQAKEARKRMRAMREAARRLEINQSRDFNTAAFGIRGAQSAWESDPGRATLRQMWEQKLANPDVLSPAQISLMKAQGQDAAAQDASGSISRIREQAQRVGLGGSRAGLGLEAGVRMNAASRNASISNDLDLAAAKANLASRDDTRQGYAGFLSNENDVRSGYAAQLASLYGNKTYGDSALLAQLR